MGKHVVRIFLLVLFIPLFSSGQCPDKGLLWKRIVFLRDSSKLPPDIRLKELLSYEVAASKCSFQNDSVRILLLQTISRIYQGNSEYTHSIQYTSKAINLVATNPGNPSINPTCQVRNYYNLALVYNLLKKTNEKIQAYDSCVAVAIRLNIVNLHLLYSLLEKVKYLNNIGEYNACISRADLGEALSHKYVFEKKQEIFGDSTRFSLNFANEKITALVILKKISEAETFLLSKIEECKRKNATDYLGSLYEQLALIKVHNNKNDKGAFSYFTQALNCYQQQKDTLSYKVAVHNIGYSIYQEIKNDEKQALIWYRKALGFKIQDPVRSKLDSIICINIYSNIANVFVRRKNFDSAQYYFQCAFNQIKNGTNESEIVTRSLDEFMQKQKVEYVTSLLIDKGDAFYEQFKHTKDTVAIQKAIHIYKLTDEFLDRIKTNQLEFQSKLFWRKDTHKFYEKAIEACKAGNMPEDAFYFFERSRAILLYDQMDEQKWLGEVDILAQRELVSKATNLQNESNEMNSGSPGFAKLQNNLWQLKEQLNQLSQQIKSRNPLYYQSFISTSFSSLAEIRRYLSLHQQTLLEIFTGETTVYSMIITGNKIYFNQVSKAAYDSAADLCHSFMSNPDLANGNRSFHLFVNSAERLYNTIFQNAPLPDGRIIISNDGRHFPFEALVTRVENNEPVYFVEKHAVSYAYSARYLMSQFPAHSSFTQKDFLGIAPVRFPGFPHLPALPGSDIAIETVKSIFQNPETLLREKATRGNFISTFGRYQVIQLYSHSSDTSSKNEPVIYFSDKPLYLSELGNMQTPVTKLIVLSACETGNGQLYQGEGVFSFSRAFAALGIPSCVNNLWSVDDESTYRITALFYKFIAEGLPTDMALQQAKVQFIKTATTSEKRPYYWAAAILSGKADIIQFKKRADYTLVLSVAIAVLMFLLVAVLIRKKSSNNMLSSKKHE